MAGRYERSRANPARGVRNPRPLMHLHWVSGGTGLPTRGIGFVLSFMGRETHATKAVLAKNLKGKPTVQSGPKQKIDGGWKFNVVANVGARRRVRPRRHDREKHDPWLHRVADVEGRTQGRSGQGDVLSHRAQKSGASIAGAAWAGRKKRSLTRSSISGASARW